MLLSGIKDVAGNLVPANTTQSSTGTKRVIGVNCGNNAGGYTSGEEFYYAPPFVSDSGGRGLQVFSIKVNGVLRIYNFDILSYVPSHTAYIFEVTGVSPLSGVITIDLEPQMAYDGAYRAAINGIEIVKP